MKFDYNGMEQICVELYASLKNLEKLFDDFEEQVSKIKSGKIWDSKAQKNFVAKCEKTNITMKQMKESFKQSIEFIGECSENYENVENSIIKEITNNITYE